jgi:hypothetical protein
LRLKYVRGCLTIRMPASNNTSPSCGTPAGIKHRVSGVWVGGTVRVQVPRLLRRTAESGHLSTEPNLRHRLSPPTKQFHVVLVPDSRTHATRGTASIAPPTNAYLHACRPVRVPGARRPVTPFAASDWIINQLTDRCDFLH